MSDKIRQMLEMIVIIGIAVIVGGLILEKKFPTKNASPAPVSVENSNPGRVK